MKHNYTDGSSAALTHVTYLLVSAGLAAAVILLRLGVKASFLPCAFIFGWFQIGGL